MTDENILFPIASEDLYRQRLDTCNACPLANHFGLIIQCSLCKCEMHLKARLARKKEGCPDGRWEK